MPIKKTKEPATDYYQIWFNVKDGEDREEFLGRLSVYLNSLQHRDVIQKWEMYRRADHARITDDTVMNVTLEVPDLESFGEAFRKATEEDPGIETMHNAVVAQVKDVHLALFKDLKDMMG